MSSTIGAGTTGHRASAGAGGPARRAVYFVGRLVLLYLLFTALWPIWKEAYRDAFAAAGQALFGSFGRNGVVRFDRFAEVEGFDIRILLWNRRTRAAVTILRNSRYTGYGLASLLAALVLATPLPWRRRWRALALGMVLLHLFVAFSLWLLLLDTFSNGDQLAVIHLPEPLKFLVALAATHLALFTTLPYVAPFVIWGLVTFRRGDWEVLLRRPPEEP
jgi:hypothetical protein